MWLWRAVSQERVWWCREPRLARALLQGMDAASPAPMASDTAAAPSTTTNAASPSNSDASPGGSPVSPSGTDASPSGGDASPSGSPVGPSGSDASPSGSPVSPSSGAISPASDADLRCNRRDPANGCGSGLDVYCCETAIGATGGSCGSLSDSGLAKCPDNYPYPQCCRVS